MILSGELGHPRNHGVAVDEIILGLHLRPVLRHGQGDSILVLIFACCRRRLAVEIEHYLPADLVHGRVGDGGMVGGQDLEDFVVKCHIFLVVAVRRCHRAGAPTLSAGRTAEYDHGLEVALVVGVEVVSGGLEELLAEGHSAEHMLITHTLILVSRMLRQTPSAIVQETDRDLGGLNARTLLAVRYVSRGWVETRPQICSQTHRGGSAQNCSIIHRSCSTSNH